MSRPRLLDLFCGAGGAARGYHDAGFDVVGVDSNPQPNYPYEFRGMDALDMLAALVRDGNLPWDHFDAIHASPVCYGWSQMRYCRPGSRDDQPDYITPLRPLLQASGLPYVIENVPGAPLENPVQLCGSSFGLTLQRHRWFETSWFVWNPPTCDHESNPWNPEFKHSTGRQKRRVPVIGEWRVPLGLQQQAMGVDWMTLRELQEAIPPAYTEWLGSRLLEHLKAGARG
jgi:DNA (cytosine-5)-methyltransferase 1